MNQRTVKLISKYAELKGLNKDNLKNEWKSLNETERFKKRQEMLALLIKR